MKANIWARPFLGSITRGGVYSSGVELHQGSRKGQSGAVYYVSQWFSMEEITDGPEEGFYEECASGRDFILVETHFPMGVNVFGGIYIFVRYSSSPESSAFAFCN